MAILPYPTPTEATLGFELNSHILFLAENPCVHLVLPSWLQRQQGKLWTTTKSFTKMQLVGG